jgi:hypothetical protein
MKGRTRQGSTPTFLAGVTLVALRFRLGRSRWSVGLQVISSSRSSQVKKVVIAAARRERVESVGMVSR